MASKRPLFFCSKPSLDPQIEAEEFLIYCRGKHIRHNFVQTYHVITVCAFQKVMPRKQQIITMAQLMTGVVTVTCIIGGGKLIRIYPSNAVLHFICHYVLIESLPISNSLDMSDCKPICFHRHQSFWSTPDSITISEDIEAKDGTLRCISSTFSWYHLVISNLSICTSVQFPHQ